MRKMTRRFFKIIVGAEKMLSWCKILVFLSVLQWASAYNVTSYTPVVMWHGMGKKILVVFTQFLIKMLPLFLCYC